MFHQRYGVDLGRVRYRRTARWFRVRLAAILADDNPLSRAVWGTHKDQEDADDE